MIDNSGKTYTTQDYLSASLLGHGIMTKLGHAGDVKAAYARLIALAEMKKRGVRFLPAQVIKRALRKHKSAQPQKSTFISDKPIVDMGEFPKMTLEE